MKHMISWIAVRPNGDTEPRQSWMKDRESGFGWDAQCSCGWKTYTGGALASYIRREIKDHKDYGWIDLLTSEQLLAYSKGLVTIDELQAVTA